MPEASKHSDSEAGRRIDAYLLGIANSCRFPCRVLKIASGLLSLCVKTKGFMHTYFRKVKSSSSCSCSKHFEFNWHITILTLSLSVLSQLSDEQWPPGPSETRARQGLSQPCRWPPCGALRTFTPGPEYSFTLSTWSIKGLHSHSSCFPRPQRHSFTLTIWRPLRRLRPAHHWH